MTPIFRFMTAAAILLAAPQAALVFAQAVAEPATPPVAEPEAKITDFDGLLALLNRDSVTHKTNLENSLVVIPTKQGPIDGVFVIRWAADVGAVHFIQPLAIKIPPEKMGQVESAVVRLNHAMPLPGLGIDHQTSTPYFRVSLPVAVQGGMTTAEVRSVFRLTLTNAAIFQPSLAALVKGETDAEKIVAFHQSIANKAIAIPLGKYTRQFADSRWDLIFRAEGEFVVLRDDAEMVQGKFAAEGDQIKFADRSGKLAAEGEGIYAWKLADGQLTFQAKSDGSQGRQMVLTSGSWSRADEAAKNPPAESSDEGSAEAK